MYDYSKLLSRILMVYGGIEKLPSVLDISPYSVANKLNNKCQFKQNEIMKLIKELGINDADVKSYFFTEKV